MTKPKDVPFLKTADPETKEKLVKEGFQLLTYDGAVWTFLNDPKKSKKDFTETDLVYSTKLEF